MLRNPDHTLQHVAGVLGFADSSAFHKAFKRWTKLTPAEYRAAAARGSSLDAREHRGDHAIAAPQVELVQLGTGR
jgi:AraC-like DNA-binding protein